MSGLCQEKFLTADFACVIAVDETVARGQVSMDEFLIGEIVHAVGDIQCKLNHGRFSERRTVGLERDRMPGSEERETVQPAVQ